MDDQAQRIQKVIARGGVFSRRKVEQLLVEKRITVNGVIVQLGCKVINSDRIAIDGKPIKQIAEPTKTYIIAYNKRVGEICSRTEKPSVYDKLPSFSRRWIGVGRLDINTSGLLLFCNHGDLASKLMHPSSQLDREYAVRVRGELTLDMQRKLTAGVVLEDGKARLLDLVESGGSGINRWYHLVVQEGRHRLIRRLIASQGLEVSRLIRVRFGTVVLKSSLGVGKWVRLTDKEVEQLRWLTEQTTTNQQHLDKL